MKNNPNTRFFLRLFFIAFSLGTVAQARPVKAPPNDVHATFEAVTGDSADEDKAVWDEFYRNKTSAFGKDAVPFLKDHIEQVKKGRAFVPAMGEGRNAIFLAKKGFTVDGNDISDVAVDKAIAEANAQHVTMRAFVADLMQYEFPENYYDFIFVSLFYKKELVPKFKKSLKKGGFLMFYNKLESQSNGKVLSPDDFPVKDSELKEALKDFQLIAYQETNDHGIKVAGILVKKP